MTASPSLMNVRYLRSTTVRRDVTGVSARSDVTEVSARRDVTGMGARKDVTGEVMKTKKSK